MGFFDYLGDLLSPNYWMNQISAFTGKSANESNVQMTRETNEMNRQLYERGIQNQWDMWNANNAYNSPAAQRQRLQDAGINPALGMLGSAGSIGQASATSAPAPPQMQAPHVDPLNAQPLVNAVLGSISAFADAGLKNQQQRGLAIDNLNKEKDWSLKFAERQANIKSSLAKAGLTTWERLAKEQELWMNQMSARDMLAQNHFNWIETVQRINESKERVLNLKAERSLTGVQEDLARMNLRMQPQVLKSVIDETYKKIELMNSQKGLTDQQLKTEVEKTLETSLHNQGIKIENKYKEPLTDALIKQYAAQTRKLNYDASGLDAGLFKVPAPDKVRGWFGGLAPDSFRDFLWPRKR